MNQRAAKRLAFPLALSLVFFGCAPDPAPSESMTISASAPISGPAPSAQTEARPVTLAEALSPGLIQSFIKTADNGDRYFDVTMLYGYFPEMDRQDYSDKVLSPIPDYQYERYKNTRTDTCYMENDKLVNAEKRYGDDWKALQNEPIWGHNRELLLAQGYSEETLADWTTGDGNEFCDKAKLAGEAYLEERQMESFLEVSGLDLETAALLPMGVVHLIYDVQRDKEQPLMEDRVYSQAEKDKVVELNLTEELIHSLTQRSVQWKDLMTWTPKQLRDFNAPGTHYDGGNGFDFLYAAMSDEKRAAVDNLEIAPEDCAILYNLGFDTRTEWAAITPAVLEIALPNTELLDRLAEADITQEVINNYGGNFADLIFRAAGLPELGDLQPSPEELND